MNLFCKITTGSKGVINSIPREHRYREALFRIAGKENAHIPEYKCREGQIFFIITCDSVTTAYKIIKHTNASYGKYIKMTGEDVTFNVSKPEILSEIFDYVRVKESFFNILYVAEDHL